MPSQDWQQASMAEVLLQQSLPVTPCASGQPPGADLQQDRHSWPWPAQWTGTTQEQSQALRCVAPGDLLERRRPAQRLALTAILGKDKVSQTDNAITAGLHASSHDGPLWYTLVALHCEARSCRSKQPGNPKP